jgi:hypothetical protein
MMEKEAPAKTAVMDPGMERPCLHIVVDKDIEMTWLFNEDERIKRRNKELQEIRATIYVSGCFRMSAGKLSQERYASSLDCNSYYLCDIQLDGLLGHVKPARVRDNIDVPGTGHRKMDQRQIDTLPERLCADLL